MNLKSDLWIDGALYSAIALFGFLQSYFTSEEAYKYVNPYTLFWLKAGVGAIGAVAGALKMFRSTTYADHRNDKKNNVDKPQTPVEPKNS